MRDDYYQTDVPMDDEILVINEVYQSLKGLSTQDEMIRVLEWVCNKLYIRASFELPRKERLLRESREMCGYVPSTGITKKAAIETSNWEPSEDIEEVADIPDVETDDLSVAEKDN